ncbi:MAG: Thymidylate kinase [uncultured Thermomicrobiales bacterium]|uniref:Thymidylate kinase n=1 Tax=uncultured Thermomicrobiales bacterium TaxID=1645740 RepID=A0A6J4UIY1_9BACT|nr:MAG: Thymidylate kinase [uncultured Thermomicrobiales bacterium]
MAGLFIALEGPEGAGKSTQALRLAARLRTLGRDVLVSREPGGTALGQELRRLVLDRESHAILAETEALLYAADRAEHVGRVLRPARDCGAIVVCDRFVDSSLAYQGAGRGLDVIQLRALQNFATGGMEPDLRLLLDLPVGVGLARRFGSGGEVNRLDAEGIAFHERVRAAYLAAAAASPIAWAVVDAAESVDEVARRVEEMVVERLGDRLGPATPSVAGSATVDRAR